MQSVGTTASHPLRHSSRLSCLVGDGIAGVAQRLNISEATARSHRIRIFQKTGVGRQSQLVGIILESSDGAVNRA